MPESCYWAEGGGGIHLCSYPLNVPKLDNVGPFRSSILAWKGEGIALPEQNNTPHTHLDSVPPQAFLAVLCDLIAPLFTKTSQDSLL